MQDSNEEDTSFILPQQNSVGSISIPSIKSNIQEPIMRKKQSVIVQQSSESSVLNRMMYKEILVVRFNDKQDKIKTKMLSEGEFHYEFQKTRPTDPYWSTISSMQLAPFNRIGLGNILKFSFCPIQIRSHDLIPSDFKITNNSLNLLQFIPKLKQTLSSQLSN